MSPRRVLIWVALAAAGVLVALLATGVLSRTTGGRNAVAPTTPPTVVTVSEAPSPRIGPATAFGKGDWGTYGGTYDETRHSPLTQIDRTNVNELGRVFSIDFRRIDPSIPKGEQSFPIAVGGVLYVTTAYDNVFAVDGGSGKVLWRWEPADTAVFSNFGINANRGVAYCDGKVYELTLDMRIVALDARTGRLVKQVAIADAVPGATVENGYEEDMAPVCYRNLLLLGASGSDFGVRGFFMAYHSDLSPAWANPYWIVPPELEGWRRGGRLVGGGTNWNPATIDPRTNVVYITTSNSSPLFDPRVRLGSNPRTDAVVALDVATGHQLWWRQQIAGDQWGYSTVQPVLLYDVKIGGRTRRVVSVATKEGVWFMYDARTGQPIYQRVKLLNQIEHPSLRPGVPVRIYPGSLGGLNYSPSSFDPGTGYVVNNQAETSAVLVQKSRALVEKSRIRGDVDLGLANGTFGATPAGWHDFGSVSAVDAAAGRVVWKFVTPEPGRGGITTTASGIGFAPGGDGVLRAFDTRNGNVLWSFQTGNQLAAGPTIYEARGKEFVAVAVGGTFTSSYGGTASRLDVFALGGNTTQSPAPPLRPPGPGPGYVAAPDRFLSLASQPQTLALQVVASMDDARGRLTLDGTTRGRMVVRVPKSWRVNVTFANHSRTNADGVVLAGGGRMPAFGGAASGDVGAGGVTYFSFNAAREGRYLLRSTVPARAALEAITVEVGPPSSLPGLVLLRQTYAIPLGSRG